MKSTKLTLISRLSFMSLCLFTFSTGTIAQDSGSSEVKAPVLETHEDDLTKPVEKAAKIGSQNPVDSIDEAIKVGEKENEAERIVTQAEIFLLLVFVFLFLFHQILAQCFIGLQTLCCLNFLRTHSALDVVESILVLFIFRMVKTTLIEK